MLCLTTSQHVGVHVPADERRERWRRLLDAFLDTAKPDHEGKSRKRKLAALGLAILAAVALLLATEFVSFPFTSAKVHAQKRAEEEYDKSKPAIEWHVEYPGVDGIGGSWALERRLTPQEEKRLAQTDGDVRAASAFMKSLGAKRIGHGTSYTTVQIHSERNDPVSITRLTAKPIRCWKMKAATVVGTGEGEAFDWEEFYFNFLGEKNANGEYPAIKTDPDPGTIEPEVPYDKVITVGGGHAPGYLKVGATAGKKSCEWVIIDQKLTENAWVGWSSMRKPGTGRLLRRR